MLSPAVFMDAMNRNRPRILDLGVLPADEKFEGRVCIKRNTVERNLARQAVAAIARVIRVIFNYAPVSTAPYQLRLVKERSGITIYAWLPVTAEQYASVEVGDEVTITVPWR